MSTYRPITQRAGQAPVRQLCRVLRVDPAAYYARQRRQQAPPGEPAWQVAVREAFAQHTQRYGTRRLRAKVQAEGHAVGRWGIRRVFHAHGLRAQQPRSVVHSDQSSQYTATRFRQLLTRHGAVASMSRRGNCYDNALPGTTHAESFWSRFKAELLDDGRFPGLTRSKSATMWPTTTPSDATQRSATNCPTTSKPIFKPRPDCVQLS